MNACTCDAVTAECESCPIHGSAYRPAPDHTRPQGIDHDGGAMYCRFLGTETCRGGLNVAEHRLESGGFRHPDGLNAKGYYAFDEEAVQ